MRRWIRIVLIEIRAFVCTSKIAFLTRVFLDRGPGTGVAEVDVSRYRAHSIIQNKQTHARASYFILCK